MSWSGPNVVPGSLILVLSRTSDPGPGHWSGLGESHEFPLHLPGHFSVLVGYLSHTIYPISQNFLNILIFSPTSQTITPGEALC